MHVLQLGPYPPPEGGINRNVLAIREGLRRMGHRCSIIATSRSSQITVEPDVYHPRTALELINTIRAIDFDVLHLHVGGEITSRIVALLAACAILGRGRSVLSFHSGGYPDSDAGRRARPSTVRGSIFRNFTRVISVNEAIDAVMERYGVRGDLRSVVLPFVGQVPDSKVELPAELRTFVEASRPFILTVGLLEPEYDLELQVDRMADVLANRPEAGSMIVGSGSLRDTLAKRIAAKPYAERILLAGDVPHPVTLHLIDKADVLLRTTTFDGDAISVREALFLGTPVIATDNRMRPEGVTLIASRDGDALVKHILGASSSEKPKNRRLSADVSNVDAVLRIYEELAPAAAMRTVQAVG